MTRQVRFKWRRKNESNNIIAAVVIALVVTFGPWANKSTARTNSDDDTTQRLNAAADVLKEIMAAPDNGIPRDLLDKAACAVIVPNVKKGRFHRKRVMLLNEAWVSTRYLSNKGI